MVSFPVHAESLVEKYSKMVSDESVKPFIKDALTKIQLVTCEENTPCTEATEEEFSKPPITIIEGRAAMAHAIVSALAQWCGLDWKRSFLPMIAYGKYHEKMTDRNLQLLTIIHGTFQESQFQFYKKSGGCPEKFKNELDTNLPKLPKK